MKSRGPGGVGLEALFPRSTARRKRANVGVRQRRNASVPLVIDQPAANARFDIDTTPRMPTIQCRARITGEQPDPTATTRFDWTIEITEAVTRSSCASAQVGNCRETVTEQGVVGGNWTPQLTTLQGGDAVITVTAPQGGATLQAQVTVRIRGTNPAATQITARLGGAGTAGDRVACHESGRRQFSADGMPLLGPGGDVGVMQLCNPAATCEERWRWAANVDGGAALLADKEAAARRHLNQHRVGGHYPNDQGLGDADVLLRETLQRYNGGSYWRWNATANRWAMSPPNQYVARVLACR